MGLLVMILGLVLFLGVHTVTTQRELRARAIASFASRAGTVLHASPMIRFNASSIFQS